MKIKTTFDIEITESLVKLSDLAPGTNYCYPHDKDQLLNKEVSTSYFLASLVCTATKLTKTLHSYEGDTVHLVKVVETEEINYPKPYDAVLGNVHR